MSLPCQRDRFDIPDDVAYLNAAYLGPLSGEVQAAIVAGSARKATPWEVEVDDFFAPVEEARTLVARLMDADADGVALIPSVSYGIAVAAANLPAARVVTLAEQFPSNVYAWRESGAEVVHVARPGDGDWTPAVLEAIDDHTDVVAVPNCHWADGTLLDLVAVGEACRAYEAALVLDLTQSLGARPFSVAEARPDFVVSSTYKWLLGPYSTAFLWVAPHRRDGRPIEWNWIARQDPQDFAGLVAYRDTYQPGARRYDVGEVSNFALVPGVDAALRQTLDWGVDAVEAYIGALTDHAAVRALELGHTLAAPHARSRHLLGIRLGGDARRLAERLGAERVYVSVRGDAVRVAPHVYNTRADVDRLMDVVAAQRAPVRR